MMKVLWPTVRRARAGTLGSQPWPWPERPRVVIEDAEGDRGLAAATALRRAGYAVAVCPGPSETREPPEGCPLVGFEGCLVVDGADVVVWRLGPEGRRVLEALRRRRPGTPLVVELQPEEADRYRGELAGCEVVVSPVSPEQLADAVERALAVRSDPATSAREG